VINMSSNVALMGVAGRDCYTAAKGGIAAITRSLAVAYAPQRVRLFVMPSIKCAFPRKKTPVM
jgi:NAD(P)-dependent dehydrogenase (short-subunit alcohol dehydrogenase family)